MSYKFNQSNIKTFCPLAWVHNFVNQDGSYQVCCTSEEFDNFIRDNNNEKIYIKDNYTPKEIMNTEFMKKLRLQMLNGEWPDMCKRCEIPEKMNGVSRRNVEVMNYEKLNDSLLAGTKDDGEISNEILSADYRLGNLCNLQCRMCNPRSTALWIKEWNEIKPDGEKFSKEVMDSYSQYDWISSDDFLEEFDLKAGSLQHIHFAGGEPLIVPQMRHILQKCIEAGNAKNIVLTYNTNLVKLPKNVTELWKHFKTVKLLASIDAVGELNNYIRYPANWDLIHKNLLYIDNNYEELNVSECMLSTTVQVLNITRMEELYKYLSQFNFIVAVPNLVNLNVPSYFQTTILPKELKDSASDTLLKIKKDYYTKIPKHYHYLLDNIDSIINFMNSADHFKTNHFKEFIKFQYKFDQKRNLNVFDHFPSLKKFLF